MFKVISAPPNSVEPSSWRGISGFAFESNEQLNATKSIHGFNFFSFVGSKKAKAPSNADHDTSNFVLHDNASLKNIKKMPVYEPYREMIVALRHVHLDLLKSDEENLSFWLNVRNSLLYYSDL